MPRIAAGDPLGELIAADRFRLQQGAITVVDVSEDAVEDVGAQLLVVGVGQLVVDDLGEDVVLPREGNQLIQLRQAQHGRLLDQDVLAGGQGLACGIEVPVVRRGDAYHVHALRQHLADGVRPGATHARPEAGLAEVFGAAAGAAGDGGQLDLDGAEVPAVEALVVQLLEDGAVGFVEDHAQAGHADAEPTGGSRCGVHRGIIAGDAARRKGRKPNLTAATAASVPGPVDHPHLPAGRYGPPGFVGSQAAGPDRVSLKNTAQVADKITICRSMTHGEAAHERGTHNMFTGYRPSLALQFPSMGSQRREEADGAGRPADRHHPQRPGPQGTDRVRSIHHRGTENTEQTKTGGSMTGRSSRNTVFFASTCRCRRRPTRRRPLRRCRRR